MKSWRRPIEHPGRNLQPSPGCPTREAATEDLFARLLNHLMNFSGRESGDCAGGCNSAAPLTTPSYQPSPPYVPNDKDRDRR